LSPRASGWRVSALTWAANLTGIAGPLARRGSRP
jgi:hypothetical protein